MVSYLAPVRPRAAEPMGLQQARAGPRPQHAVVPREEHVLPDPKRIAAGDAMPRLGGQYLSLPTWRTVDSI
jgi:hypothetical protein